MAKIHKGRFTASVDGAFVVFLIGMRVNKPWKVRSWLPVAKAMPGMQRELLAQPELGCVSMSNWMGARGSLSVQYWRDFESLDAYARDPNQGHLPAWRAFNKAIRDNAWASGTRHIRSPTELSKPFTATCPHSASRLPSTT